MNYDDIFAPASLEGGVASGNAMDRIYSTFASRLTRAGQIPTEVASKVASLEGLRTPSSRPPLVAALTTLKETIDSAVKSATTMRGVSAESFKPAAQKAAAWGALIASDPRSYLAASKRQRNNQVASTEGATLVPAYSQPSDRVPSFEAYDTATADKAALYTASYNLAASMQDEFTAAFYPTTTVAPDNFAYAVTIPLHLLQGEVQHSLLGTPADFRRRNVIEAAIDPELLKDDRVSLIPVLRSGANDNSAMFVAGIAATNVAVTDTLTVPTAPLAFGKEVNLLGLSSRDDLVRLGALDSSDAIGTSIHLKTLTLKLTSGATSEFFDFDLADHMGTAFTQAPQQNQQGMVLNVELNGLLLKSSTTVRGGGASTLLAALATNTVRLKVRITGNVDRMTGTTSLMAGDVTILRTQAQDGSVYANVPGAISTLLSTANLKAAGYVIGAQFTNSNVRQRGKLIDTQYVSNVYSIPLRPPFTALRPINGAELSDSEKIQSLVTLTRIATSINGVTALFRAKSQLKAYVLDNDTFQTSPQLFGMASYLLKPTFIEDQLDCLADLQSLTTNDRIADLQQLLVNKIRDIGFNLYRKSNYQTASQSMNGGIAVKPTLLIGTDIVTARYLQITGDTRLATEFFDYKIVTTVDNRMIGQIAIALGSAEAMAGGEPSVLHWGTMAWKPEVVMALPLKRGESTSVEVTVQSCYEHINNMPVLGWLEVTNLSEAATTKVAVNTHSV